MNGHGKSKWIRLGQSNPQTRYSPGTNSLKCVHLSTVSYKMDTFGLRRERGGWARKGWVYETSRVSLAHMCEVTSLWGLAPSSPPPAA